MAATNVASLAIKITGDSTKFLRALRGIRAPLTRLSRQLGRISKKDTFKGASKGADNFSRKLAILARAARNTLGPMLAIGKLGLIGVGAVGALAKSALDIAGGFEQAKIALSVLLRSTSKGEKLFQTLLKFSAATPFSFEDILQSTRQLLAFGIAEDQLLPSLKAVGELSAATGTSLKELAFVYGQTRAELRLYSRDIKQFSTKGIPLIAVLAKLKGVTESQVFDLAEQGRLLFPDVVEAFKVMTEQGGQFFGGIAKQAASLKGLQTTLKDSIKIMLGRVGDKLIETMDLKNLISGLVRGINTRSGSISSVLSDLILSVGRITLWFIKAFKAIIGFIFEGMKEISGFLSSFFASPGIVFGAFKSSPLSQFFTAINNALGGNAIGVKTAKLGLLGNFLDPLRTLADPFGERADADARKESRPSNRGPLEHGPIFKFVRAMADLGGELDKLISAATKPAFSLKVPGLDDFKELWGSIFKDTKKFRNLSDAQLEKRFRAKIERVFPATLFGSTGRNTGDLEDMKRRRDERVFGFQQKGKFPFLEDFIREFRERGAQNFSNRVRRNLLRGATPEKTESLTLVGGSFRKFVSKFSAVTSGPTLANKASNAVATLLSPAGAFGIAAAVATRVASKALSGGSFREFISKFSVKKIGPSSFVDKLLDIISPLEKPEGLGGKDAKKLGSQIAASISPVGAAVRGEGGTLAAIQRAVVGGGGNPLLRIAKRQLEELVKIAKSRVPAVATVGSP